MNLTAESVAQSLDEVHRNLATQLVDQLRGIPTALNMADILERNPTPLRPKTLSFLKKILRDSRDGDEVERLQRLMFGCTDLMVEEQNASLNDMFRFYIERGRMVVDGIKIPALDVVSWLQAQPDFEKREAMLKENSIFLKGILNPMLLGMLELTIKTVVDLGYDNFTAYSENKRQVSFDDNVSEFTSYLEKTERVYHELMTPWVEESIGRPFQNLSRCHALYLIRIREWDSFFSVNSLFDKADRTFKKLGFDLMGEGVVTDLSAKNTSGMCVGVEIPGDVYVLLKPTGGLLDMETLLHEAGHAFFLSNFNPALPVEFRRIFRSAALDETFAFLFMGLLENTDWLSQIGGIPDADLETISGKYRTKRLCLIRRYIGKFFAEKDLHDNKDIKNPDYYCRYLQKATGFVYEPEGYLIDMEPNFYSLDYLSAWGGADLLADYLASNFGSSWFLNAEAGAFLKNLASDGRKYSLEDALVNHCGRHPRLPEFG